MALLDELVVRLTGDGSSFQRALKAASSQSAEFNRTLAAQSASSAGVMIKTEAQVLAGKRQAAREATAAANAAAREEAAARRFAAAEQGRAVQEAVAKSRQAARDEAAGLREAQRAAREVAKERAAADRQQAREAQRSAAEAAALPSRLDRVGATAASAAHGLQAMGETLTQRVTDPIMEMAAHSVQAFADFDDAMTKSTSIMNATQEQTDRLRKAALDLSTVTTRDPEHLAKGYYPLIASTQSAEKALLALPIAHKFAVAGNFDMATSTNALTTTLNAMGMASDDATQYAANMARVGNTVARASKFAGGSMEQFSMALTRDAGASAAMFGKDIEEVVAVLAAYSKQGIRGEYAGNMFGRMLRLLSASATKNAAAFKHMGVDVFDETSGKMRHVSDIMLDLQKATAGLSDEERVAALKRLGFGVLQQKAVIPLLKMGKDIRGFDTDLRSTGDVIKEISDKQLASFTSQLKILKNNITVVAIEIGAMLAPYLRQLMGWVVPLVQWFRGLDEGTRRTVVAIALAAAAVGPLLLGLKLLPVAFGFLLSLFGPVVALFKVGVFVVGLLLSKFVLIGAAVAGAAVALLYYTGAGGALLAWFGGQWDALVTHVQPAVDGIKAALAQGNLALAWDIVWAQIQLSFATATYNMRSAWTKFVASLKFGMSEAAGASEGYLSRMAGGLRVVLDGLAHIGTGRTAEQRDRALADIATTTEAQVAADKKRREQQQRGIMHAEAAEQKRLKEELARLEAQRDALADSAVNAPELLGMPKEEQVAKAAAAAEGAGRQIGRGATKGVKDEINKFDAVLFSSAEAFSRFAAQQEGLLGKGQKFAEGNEKFAQGLSRFDAAGFGAEGASRVDKQQLEVLKRILEETRRKPNAVEFEDADL